MTFLELVRRLSQEASISGEGPPSVVGQTGENRNLVNWINASWEEIQLKSEFWRWRRDEFTFATVADKQHYTPAEAGIATRFSRWVQNSFWVYETALGLQNATKVTNISYELFKPVHIFGTTTKARPDTFAVDYVNRVWLGPTPASADFSITGEYVKSVQHLTANDDVPEMPEDFHMAIVWSALMKYATTEAAAELYEIARDNYRRYMNRLEIDQLPQMDEAITLE